MGFLLIGGQEVHEPAAASLPKENIATIAATEDVFPLGSQIGDPCGTPK